MVMINKCTYVLMGVLLLCQHVYAQIVPISVNVAQETPIPHDFYGVFFEEINHAGTGGLWAELVANRGFEYGGGHSPPAITPWTTIGDDKSVNIGTELVSCFKHNPVALRMDVLCDGNCPFGGVGIFKPGYWGMNVGKGKSYKLIFFVKATGALELTVSFTTSDGTQVLASANIVEAAAKVQNWSRMELTLQAEGSDPNARLQLTSNKNGTIWLDQVSAMPTDTFKGHGFRKDMVQMMMDLRPRFIRFPGGCYVEGQRLKNAFRWKKTVGPWEERPGHMGDVWQYWSDDGLGYLEYLQVVNLKGFAANLALSLNGVNGAATQGARKTVLTSNDLWGDNSIDNPRKMVPRMSLWQATIGNGINLQVDPYSLTAFDLLCTAAVAGEGGTNNTHIPSSTNLVRSQNNYTS